MRIESSDGLLVYMADTGPQDNLVDIARDADILICEGAYVDHAEVADVVERPHLSAYEAGTIAREAGARQLILTHYWASLGPENYVKAAEEGYQGKVTLAEPGVTLEVTNLVR
jgi:ribonuclease BN (tRNA processing enzyme)